MRAIIGTDRNRDFPVYKVTLDEVLCITEDVWNKYTTILSSSMTEPFNEIT